MGETEQESDGASDTSTVGEQPADDGSVDERSDEQPADDQEPTAQPSALRRQQQYAAAGGSILTGLAVTVSIVQRFPEYTAVAVLAGVASTYLVYRLAAGSVFPGEQR